jgi:L-ascorbate metabolism protein UlaG (beta-lactamase superfamily)
MGPKIQVTLTANAGVLLRVQDTTILLDALFGDADTAYCAPSPAAKEKMLCGEPPFENVDYVMFTHLHRDHFSEEFTREFLSRHTVKGLLLPGSDKLEQSGFFGFVKETGTPCYTLTEQALKTVFRLSPDVQVTAYRTLHLDKKYHDVPHFCYRIAFGEKKLLFTSDADYTEETFAFLGEETLRAAFVNPLFFSDLQRRRFFRGSLPAETVVVYHLPFPEEEEALQRMFAQALQTWQEEGPPAVVLDRQLKTIEL